MASGHGGLDDLARRARRLALGQGVDVVHAIRHFAPDGVLTVEEGGVVKADEELAVGAVGIGGAGHRTDAAGVALPRELGLQVGLGRARGAGSGRVAALGHEAGDDAVEDHAVVEAFPGQFGDAGGVTGGQIGAQLDDDIAIFAVTGVESESQGFVGHRRAPCQISAG
eukprot:TRINITY_DN20410_c0_g1_i1.p1 TRINITY_DN20410_c0_g1~~TRINITY_DN20410_c0_g1_i1.p1  ORF type:complete len:168 (+),score=12.83 TRINITY_DN20410_c0_g1_i1:247-750(+)